MIGGEFHVTSSNQRLEHLWPHPLRKEQHYCKIQTYFQEISGLRDPLIPKLFISSVASFQIVFLCFIIFTVFLDPSLLNLTKKIPDKLDFR